MTGLSSLLGALGLVGVLFALANFVVLLFSGGAGLASAGDLIWIGGNLAIGVILLVAAAMINLEGLRERMFSGEARRAGKYGSSAIVSTVLGIAILAMLGFLASRYPRQFDWSEQKVHTLSDQTQKTLAGLDTDVEVLVLVNKLDEAPIRWLLDRYDLQSERFSVDYADPNVSPGLLQQYGISAEELGEGRGLVRVAIGGNSVELSEISEESVTNAIVKLSRTGEKVVYFLEGHGERAISGESGTGRSGFSNVATALRNENYRIEPLLLAAQGEVPADADVLVIAGPTRSLLDVEADALDRYLARGGAVLALVDPRIRTGIVQRLAAWGVVLGDDVIVDRTLALFGRAMSPFAASYDPKHEITRDLREATLFHEARSVTAADGFSAIVFTGEASWAERDLARLDTERETALDDSDLRGPVAVGAAGRPMVVVQVDAEAEAAEEGAEAEADESEPRLVAFGDADFASNEYLDTYSNRDLFVNSVNWLMGDVEAIGVRPNRSRASRFQLTAEQFRTIRMVSLFLLPEAIAVLGVFTWWSRRNTAS
jgi:ABC-type uncharacterized transport system involved in gliding motility auxiliary subunit